jgi:hypothetical protein
MESKKERVSNFSKKPRMERTCDRAWFYPKKITFFKRSGGSFKFDSEGAGKGQMSVAG